MPDLHDKAALAGRLLMAQEDEQRRIAREMHDDIAQRLAALAFDLETLQEKQRTESAIPGEDLRKLIRAVTVIADGVREISHQLYPAILEDLGLAAALRSLVEEFARRDELSIEVSLRLPPDPAMPLATGTALYRIAQEALRNVIKHSPGASVLMEVKEAGQQRIQLTIRDNGAGFDAEAVRAGGGGLGLAGMEERARAVGGRLTLESAPGAGTTVTVAIPWLATEANTAANHAVYREAT